MIGRLFRRSEAPPPRPETPADTRIYAIGDIHGRVDLLRGLHQRIAADAAGAAAGRKLVIYLGDYVDRGLSCREVIDLLLDEPLDGVEAIHLRGNHEEFMLHFLEDRTVGTNWFLNGGDTTAASFGVGQSPIGPPEERWQRIQDDLRRNIPVRHMMFLRSLRLFHAVGDYFFVHAGIRPGRALDRQDRRDLLWIRGDFLDSKTDHGKCVVHGHSVTKSVEMLPNRIGIDTGAYFSDKLSCLVLEGAGHEVIQT